MLSWLEQSTKVPGENGCCGLVWPREREGSEEGRGPDVSPGPALGKL